MKSLRMKQIVQSLRQLKRSPLLLFVSIPSLAIGLAGFLLLMIYIQHETAYDQEFKNKEKIYRLYTTLTERGESYTWPICMRDISKAIKTQVPEVDEVVQVYRGWKNTVKYEDMQLDKVSLLYVDNDFFKVFARDKPVQGNSNMLNSKNTVVLTRSLSLKLFAEKSPIGKVIRIGDEDYTVTGMVEDFPKTTHFQSEMFASISSVDPDSFGGLEFFTYYLLAKNADPQAVGKKIAALNTKIINAKWGKNNNTQVSSGVENLQDIHLYSKTDWDFRGKGNIKNLYIVGFLAFLILLIAVVNHINLYILYGEKRYKEIATRKYLGANWSRMAGIFYTETALLTMLAFGFAILLTYAGIQSFGDMMQINLSFDEVQNTKSILEFLLFLFFLIAITGGYPAFYLSRLPAIDMLRGHRRIVRRKGLAIASVIVQFTISIFLIVNLIIVHSQISFLKNIPLGLKTENVYYTVGFNQKISSNWQSISEELKKYPFVNKVAASDHSMGGGCSGQMIMKLGDSPNNASSINEYRIQAGFCDLMQMQLIQGRFFKKGKADKKNVILNQAAVKMLNLKHPVGKQVIMFEDPMEIVGVVKDFYYYYPGARIEALALTCYSDRINSIYWQTSKALTLLQRQKIKKVFVQFDPDFAGQIGDLQELFNQKYSREERLKKILFVGTLLALLISFAAMYALSSFNVERRIKEIGVRKVLGSSTLLIVQKILYDTLKWVVMAMPLAFVISYWIMHKWLETYPLRVGLSWNYFLLGGVIALFIAMLAVLVKTIQAARQNPVKSLRYE